MKILITAFEEFGKSSISCSKEVAKTFEAQENIHVAYMPVSYARAERMIEDLIELYRPDLLLMLGQAGADKQIRIENIAINRRDVALEDIDGHIAHEELIDESEPLALFAPSAVCLLRDRMKALGLHCKRSNTAGLFVCNATFFRAISVQRKKYPQMSIVFLHYPILPEQQNDYPERYIMPLEDMVRAAQIVIDYYEESSNSKD